MNRLKSKASRYFKETLGADERAAASTDARGHGEGDFTAGIEVPTIRKTSSLWSLRKSDKSLQQIDTPPVPDIPAAYQVPPLWIGPLEDTLDRPRTAIRDGEEQSDPQSTQAAVGNTDRQVPKFALQVNDKPLPDLPTEKKSRKHFVNGRMKGVGMFMRETCDDESEVKQVKKKTSFMKLKTKGSHLFHFNKSSTATPTASERSLYFSPTSSPLPKPFGKLSAPLSSKNYNKAKTPFPRLTISRPIPTSQPSPCTPVSDPKIFPFVKPDGPPPPRPPRPSSLDSDTIEYMRCKAVRQVLGKSIRLSGDSPHAVSNVQNQFAGQNLEARPDIHPSHHVVSTPYGTTLGKESLSTITSGRLAKGSLMSNSPGLYDKFETYLSGAEYKMERRAGGKLGGEPGTLWKDEEGGWSFVPDI